MTDTDTKRALTAAELAEIRERADAATEGPWFQMDLWIPWLQSASIYIQEDDGEFIAHSRTDVPRLLDTVDALRAALRDVLENCVERKVGVALDYNGSVQRARALLDGD